MEGSWRVYAPGERWGKAGHTARVVLDTGEKVGVGFQLGIVELVLREHEDQVVGHLGPDLLGPDWDEHEAVRRLTADPDRPLGEALLDQRNLAGIGTIYRTELCFLTGYDPRSPVRRGDRPVADGPAGAHAAVPEPPPPPDRHDRRQAPGAEPVGLRQAQRTVPALRHADRVRRAGRAGPVGVLVPVLPAASTVAGQAAEATTSERLRARMGSREVSSAAASSTATASETSRSTSDSGTSRASHSE